MWRLSLTVLDKTSFHVGRVHRPIVLRYLRIYTRLAGAMSDSMSDVRFAQRLRTRITAASPSTYENRTDSQSARSAPISSCAAQNAKPAQNAVSAAPA